MLFLMQTSCATSPNGSGKYPINQLVDDANTTIPADVKILHSTNISATVKTVTETAYVTVRDKQNLTGQILEKITRELQQKGFNLTKQPSHADIIIDVAIQHRGMASSAALEAYVKAGYGSSTMELSGGEQATLVADVLFVPRKVPARTATGSLRNISERNATKGTSIRVAVSASPQAIHGRGLEQALAQDISMLAQAGNRNSQNNTAVHQQSRRHINHTGRHHSTVQKKKTARHTKRGL